MSEDGRTLSYSVGATREEIASAEQAEYDRGIRIDETTPIGQGLFRSGFIDGRLATQRLSDNGVERVPLLADVPDRWKSVDVDGTVATGIAVNPPSEPLVASDVGEGQMEPWKLAQDQLTGRIALLVRIGDVEGLVDKPGVQLSMLPRLRARRRVQCIGDLCSGKNITGTQWRPNSDEVLFTVTNNDAGLAQSIYRWNVETGAVQIVVRSAGLLSGGRDTSSACGLCGTCGNTSQSRAAPHWCPAASARFVDYRA